MLIFPLAPLPTVALMVVGSITENDAATLPPKVTAVVPVKLVPIIVTTVPGPALVGENEVSVGKGKKVKISLLVAMPPRVVRVIGPVAPLPMLAVSEVRLRTENEAAAIPPIDTALTPLKLVPVIDIAIPEPAVFGVNAVMEGGGGMTMKFVGLLTVPPSVVTVIAPVCAPAGTLAVMAVEDIQLMVFAMVPLNFTMGGVVKFFPVIMIVA